MEENGRKILKSNLLEENIDAQFSIFKPPDLTHFLAAADIQSYFRLKSIRDIR